MVANHPKRRSFEETRETISIVHHFHRKFVSSECVRQFFAAVTSTAARRGLQRSHNPRVGFHKSGRNKRTGDGHVERRERIYERRERDDQWIP